MCLVYYSLKCIKLYLTKLSEWETESIKMCGIHIHLIINPFTLTCAAYDIYCNDCCTLSE